MERFVGEIVGGSLLVFIIYYISFWLIKTFSKKNARKDTLIDRLFALFACTAIILYIAPKSYSDIGSFHEMLGGLLAYIIGITIISCFVVLKLDWRKSLLFSFFTFIFGFLISNIYSFLASLFFGITKYETLAFHGVLILAYSPLVLAIIAANNKLPWIKIDIILD